MIAQPVISVFMPVFNGEKFLKKSIESVLDQTFRSFELVCVDDSSTDGCSRICVCWYAEAKRVGHEQASGMSQTPNCHALKFASLEETRRREEESKRTKRAIRGRRHCNTGGRAGV